MRTLAEFSDDQFSFSGIRETRKIARALVVDEAGNVALHFISRNDSFGQAEYYETPGGGVEEGETYQAAAIRECREELGYKVEIIGEIGIVRDYYNLIGRCNLNHYFLASRRQFVGTDFKSHGDSLIKKTIWVSISEAIRLYENVSDKPIAILVKRRELIVLRAAQQSFKKVLRS
jgi:8-oxo-dGTP pyrophosphatase MutT (NUDIX family)